MWQSRGECPGQEKAGTGTIMVGESRQPLHHQSIICVVIDTYSLFIKIRSKELIMNVFYYPPCLAIDMQ